MKHLSNTCRKVNESGVFASSALTARACQSDGPGTVGRGRLDCYALWREALQHREEDQ